MSSQAYNDIKFKKNQFYTRHTFFFKEMGYKNNFISGKNHTDKPGIENTREALFYDYIERFLEPQIKKYKQRYGADCIVSIAISEIGLNHPCNGHIVTLDSELNILERGIRGRTHDINSWRLILDQYEETKAAENRIDEQDKELGKETQFYKKVDADLAEMVLNFDLAKWTELGSYLQTIQEIGGFEKIVPDMEKEARVEMANNPFWKKKYQTTEWENELKSRTAKRIIRELFLGELIGGKPQ